MSKLYLFVFGDIFDKVRNIFNWWKVLESNFYLCNYSKMWNKLWHFASWYWVKKTLKIKSDLFIYKQKQIIYFIQKFC